MSRKGRHEARNRSSLVFPSKSPSQEELNQDRTGRDVCINRVCAKSRSSGIKPCESKKFCVEFISFRARVNAHHRNWGTTVLVGRQGKKDADVGREGGKRNEIWICETLNQMFWKHEEPTSLNLPKASVQQKLQRNVNHFGPNPSSSFKSMRLWRLDFESYM